MGSSYSMRVLVADTDIDHNMHLLHMLETWGQVVQTASGPDEAMAQLTAFGPDVVLTTFPIASRVMVPVIAMTAFGSAERAVETVDDYGAFWFLEKPASPEILRVLLDRANQYARLQAENGRFRAQAVSQSLPVSLPIRVGMSIDEAERVLLEATLSDLGNNKTHAARALGISAKTLHQKLRQYRLQDAPNPPSTEHRNAGA
jgi:DNA-binding NtrC family response regulator